MLVVFFALILAAVCLFLSFPKLLRNIQDRRRQKRQNAVRDVIRRRGVATKADMTRDGIPESDAAKAISEMHRSGEIVPSMTGEVALWKFKNSPSFWERRTA